jgi:hypothetical protein
MGETRFEDDVGVNDGTRRATRPWGGRYCVRIDEVISGASLAAVVSAR